ncbi:pentapeptide repeat-containing protein, partial [Salmonella enterica]|nr:pentapeptide repeat-containing protein [Salmonella enterica]EIK1793132.1 pentapeptide repeat-containing protein [Salmonella enterica]
FHEVSFHECKISGVDWTQAHWPEFNLYSELFFNKSILTNSSFLGLKLHDLKIIDCRLHEVDFRECDLTSSEITGCDMSGSLFNNTNLRSTNFSDSWGFNINVLQNSVIKAKFSRQEALVLLECLGIELVD